MKTNIWFCLGTLVTDYATIVGVILLDNVQIVVLQSHPCYIVQIDEQPSPFSTLPSSHGSL